LAGFEKYEDAAVYRLSDKQALIFTLDLITPIVDDPYTFGQIAAANALSDVFGMGANPLMALNAEAGALLVGGHTIKDKEPKYGLAVVGLIHPQDIIYNDTTREGDLLILTKPLGTGILSTALKGDIADGRKRSYFLDDQVKSAFQRIIKITHTRSDRYHRF
jgi:selenide,water dikinase